jgi:hypothetical protein
VEGDLAFRLSLVLLESEKGENRPNADERDGDPNDKTLRHNEQR